jgi:hypothetical protein
VAHHAVMPHPVIHRSSIRILADPVIMGKMDEMES